MSSKNYLSVQLFDFVRKNPLLSQFSGLQVITELLGVNVDELTYDLVDPEDLFAQLIHSTVELELIDVLALMGWDGGEWKTAYGHHAMQNWWKSVLAKDRKDASYLTSVMLLRSVLADTEKYPAPKDIVQVMRQVLQQLIREGRLNHLKHLDVIEAIVVENAKKLAKLAIMQQQTVTQLIKEVHLPQKLPTVQQGTLEWLKLWIESKPKDRQVLRSALNEVLNRNLNTDQQYQYTKIIFQHNTFSAQIEYLKLEVKHYPELVAWLSACARQPEFKALLSTEERQWLNCWIGTGNYESLRHILVLLAKSTQDESDVTKTINRYIFWKNYQHYIQEAWLLLPPYLFKLNKNNLPNIKCIQDISYPCVAIKLGDYFVFQSFLGTASQNDLRMTDDITKVELILARENVFEHDLLALSHVLIHDHLFMWQSDLAFTLDQNFSIRAKDRQVYFAEGKNSFSEYMTEVKKSDYIHERKQWKNLPIWVKNSLKLRYPPEVYRKAALTVERYGLLD